MMKGELIKFCKDFDIAIPQSKELQVFARASGSQAPLFFDQFKDALPMLGHEIAKAKAKEIKLRLREYKAILEFPE
jgi:hypothetical protein